MRWNLITSVLLIAPCAGALAAQDTTQAQKQTQSQNQDTLNQQQSNRGTYGGALNDEIVLRQLHRANLMEIQAAQLAQRNASSAKVKQFAARIVRDHQAADKKVLASAKQIGITLPPAGERGRMRGQWADSTSRQGYMGRDTTNQQGYMGRDTASQQQGYMRRDSTARTDTTNRQGYPQSYQQRGESGHDGDMAQLRSLRGAAFDTAFANAMVKGHEDAINLLEMAQSQVQHDEVRSLITSLMPTLREHLQTAQSLTGATTTTSSSQ